MKKSFLRLLLFFVLTVQLFSDNKFYIKFNKNINIDLLRKYNKLSDVDFNKLLGEFKITPFISDNLLSNLYIKKNYSDAILSSENVLLSLKSIFIIESNSKFSSQIIISKLKNKEFIDYIEIAPESNIFFEPNDSLKSEQYYLDNILAKQAWDIINSNDTVIVGIVDTGVDIYHEDLKENIWINPNESGLDSLGIDKANNGIDDDNNGFIDDYIGWDFVSDSTTGQDNLPLPGNGHGTHVAGIIGAIINNGKGIAGVAKNVKILPVKIASDSPFATSVQRSYEGILYAAINGAKIINCSWGNNASSKAEQELIDFVTKLGVLVVAAAGNSGINEAFYPAGYNGVLSVAAVNSGDNKAGFSNYDNSVDVSAPGVGIISTIPNNEYYSMSGTSMASPVAAAVCALAKLQNPNFSALELSEFIKQNSDEIDSLNISYKGMIGLGRVNAYKAVTSKDAKSVVISNLIIKDKNENGIYEENEDILIDLSLTNVFDEIKDVSIKLNLVTNYSFKIQKDSIFISNLKKSEIITIDSAFIFSSKGNLPLDFNLPIEIKVLFNNKVINREKRYLSFNPSYKTMDGNNIKVTFNSSGNIGYNDYPSNRQGEGFIFKDGSDMLFEGGLMIGVNMFLVSNVIRGEFQSLKDKHFISNLPFIIEKESAISNQDGTAEFSDINNLLATGINVKQRVYQFNANDNANSVIIHYDLENKSVNNYDSLFVGLFFDWDIGSSSSSNIVDFDDTTRIGYAFSTKDTNSYFSGVSLLSNQNLNYFAIDNDGNSDDNPGIYDGFTTEEKYRTLSSGFYRKKSNITDASQVISAGPIKLNQGEKTTVSFGILAGKNLNELRLAATEAQKLFLKTDIISSKNQSIIFPNPTTGQITIDALKNSRLYIYSLLGEELLSKEIFEGRNQIKIELNEGVYVIKIFENDKINSINLIQIIK